MKIQGHSLLELLISLGLGSLLVLMAIIVFFGLQRQLAQGIALEEVQQAGREVVFYLQQGIAKAGFSGCQWKWDPDALKIVGEQLYIKGLDPQLLEINSWLGDNTLFVGNEIKLKPGQYVGISGCRGSVERKVIAVQKQGPRWQITLDQSVLGRERFSWLGLIRQRRYFLRETGESEKALFLQEGQQVVELVRGVEKMGFEKLEACKLQVTLLLVSRDQEVKLTWPSVIPLSQC